MGLSAGVIDRIGTERVQDYRERRSDLDDADRYRPRYHFTPPGGTLHDPNGALYRDGEYHLFYQYWPPDVPGDLPWDEAMHWGHAVSDDLVNWHDLPVALAPDPGPERSCFSGQALVEDERVVLTYHGPGAGNCIATSDDDLLVDWEKHPENPVIDAAAFDHRVFDPDIWREDGDYYALSGTFVGERGVDSRPVAFCYRSSDLADWELVGRLLDDTAMADPGEDAAVPNFFPLGDRHVLVCFSHRRGPYYYVGDYDRSDHSLDPDVLGRLTHGPTTHRGNLGGRNVGTLHAPSVLADGDRQVAFFNVIEGHPGDRGWSGVVALPRRLTLGDDDRLQVTPVTELEALRAESHDLEPRPLPCGEEVVLDGGGTQLEVEASIDRGDAGTVTLRLFRSPDGAVATEVTYYDRTDALALDTAPSATEGGGHARQPEAAPLRLDEGEPLELRAYLDRSVVEVYANGRQSLTGRAYPAPGSDGLALRARGGDARLDAGRVHDLAAARFSQG